MVVVGVQADHLPRVLCGHGPGNLVGQAEHTVRDAAQPPASRALAVPSAIGSFHGNHVPFRLATELLQHVLGGQLADLGIADAELGPLPLAAHQGQILRMLVERPAVPRR